MNKSLDYNKLLEDQSKGKQRSKKLTFPLMAEVKYDGNYVSVKVESGKTTFITSGRLTYTHEDNAGDIFTTLPEGVYLCERIAGKGLLGERARCNLHGPKSAQKSKGHSYIIHDWLPIVDWTMGYTILDCATRTRFLIENLHTDYLPVGRYVKNHEELDELLKKVVQLGYEGLMLKSDKWNWKRTSSRNIEFCKYKKRRTADLKCIGVTDGLGKYEGLIGALILQDSEGRIVQVGSGLTDSARHNPEYYFLNKIVEIEYEQILDTYIQPTYIRIRQDKEVSD